MVAPALLASSSRKERPMKRRLSNLLSNLGIRRHKMSGRRSARGAALTAATAAVALALGMSASAATAQQTSTAARAAYLSSQLPIPARVADLLGRMTLAEKIGQMVQIEVTQVTDTNNACTSQGGFNLPNPVCEQKIFVTNDAGSVLAGATDIPPDTTGGGGPGNTGLGKRVQHHAVLRDGALAAAYPGHLRR